MEEIWKIIEGYPNYMVSNKGRVKSLNYHRERKEKIGKSNSLPILQIDINTGLIIRQWDSISEAQRTLKLYHICDCLKNKRNSCGGYIWKYA